MIKRFLANYSEPLKQLNFKVQSQAWHKLGLPQLDKNYKNAVLIIDTYLTERDYFETLHDISRRMDN